MKAVEVVVRRLPEAEARLLRAAEAQDEVVETGRTRRSKILIGNWRNSWQVEAKR